MGELSLFRIADGLAAEIKGGPVTLEKSLQNTIEANMETLFGVQFLASEFSTGARHRGRIDSLGLDENGSPVIFEYKRAVNENVINQGLFYLDWLMDHRGEFKLLVQERLGSPAAEGLDWSSPRLVCVAGDFTRYDEHAVLQVGRSIDLFRYRDFEGGLLALDLLVSTSVSDTAEDESVSPRKRGTGRSGYTYLGVQDALERAPSSLKEVYANLDAKLMALGEDVTVVTRKYYFAYRRVKNFICVEVRPQSGDLLLYLKLNPKTIQLEDGFSRDVSELGHAGTGDLEVRISTSEGLQKAFPLIQRSYEEG